MSLGWLAEGLRLVQEPGGSPCHAAQERALRSASPPGPSWLCWQQPCPSAARVPGGGCCANWGTRLAAFSPRGRSLARQRKLSVDEHPMSLAGFAECVPEARLSECFVTCLFFQGIRYEAGNNWQHQFKVTGILLRNFTVCFTFSCAFKVF